MFDKSADGVAEHHDCRLKKHKTKDKHLQRRNSIHSKALSDTSLLHTKAELTWGRSKGSCCGHSLKGNSKRCQVFNGSVSPDVQLV